MDLLKQKSRPIYEQIRVRTYEREGESNLHYKSTGEPRTLDRVSFDLSLSFEEDSTVDRSDWGLYWPHRDNCDVFILYSGLVK